MKIAQASDNNCCARAISTMRLALGYEEGLPPNWEMGGKHTHELVSSLDNCFPGRRIIVACRAEEMAKSTHTDRICYLGEKIAYGGGDDDVDLDRYLFAFVFCTSDENSHIVVGTPGFRAGQQPDGFKIPLVFAVSLEQAC